MVVVLISIFGNSAASGTGFFGASAPKNTVSLDEIDDPDGRATSILAEAFGGRFAGTWVDHQTDGRRQVAVVDPLPSDASTAHSALTGSDVGLVGNGVDIVAMTRSLADLEALEDAAQNLIQQAGLRNYMIGVNIIENVVDGAIDVDSWDDDALRPLRELIAESDGALVLRPARISVYEQPANWPTICFVRLSYEVFLGRSPSAADEQAWAAFIQDDLPAHLVGPFEISRFYFDLLVTSDEWLGGTVADLYRQALDRSPDPAGSAFWTRELRRGARVNKVASFVFGSAELHARSGGTDQAFVTQLYERILRRSPDAPGLAYWVEQVRARSLDSVAARFFDAHESRASRVGALYEKVLGRSPDAQGLEYWSERLTRMDDVRLAVHLAASTEFIYRSGILCDPPPHSIPL